MSRILFFVFVITTFIACDNPSGVSKPTNSIVADTARLSDGGEMLSNKTQPQDFNPAKEKTDSAGGQKHYLTVREGEIDTFVQALAKVQVIRMDAMQEMDQAILEEGIALKDFSNYMKAVQTKQVESLELNSTELAKYQNLEKLIGQKGKEGEIAMEKAVESTGLTMDRYIHIGMVSEQNKELARSIQQRIQQYAKPGNTQ